MTVSSLLGELLRWIVIIVALVPTVQALGLERVSDLLTLLLGYLPNVVLAVVVVLLGAVFAQFARDIVVGASSSLGSTVSRTLGQVARWSILIFAVLAALSQLGVAQDLILTLFQGFVALVAIAGGLAFGLGGQEAAKDIIKKVREEVTEKK
ncbi:MAG: hypothetical protein A2Y57_00220 [Candidatus Woykebacteria bacterium RBG_13_40_7b]|uniref:Small-conductance mechanosensitive ion channel n=1 Tax=Candidatus Woykebacteria bacterium RBG_13_40_7b TaxID=1802594 RepID=A0A1G1W5Y3_9BACT|nr:MAG: hypothetical protein A2Y57_00220 [Candidatus Woykebacteria bacterium RBG_13_40_7b]